MNSRQHNLLIEQQKMEELLESLTRFNRQELKFLTANVQSTDENNLADKEAVELPWSIVNND